MVVVAAEVNPVRRFLIQVSHDPDPWACARVVETFLRTGSHYLAQADWGCTDGEHTAWMIVDAESKEEALQVVPRPFRREARVVRLNKFTLPELARLMRHHQRRPAGPGPGLLVTDMGWRRRERHRPTSRCRRH